MGSDGETLKIYVCEKGHRWEAISPDDGCPECGKPAKLVRKVNEEETEEEKQQSGESGFANDPDPYGRNEQ
jgi:hypothetical protein